MDQVIILVKQISMLMFVMVIGFLCIKARYADGKKLQSSISFLITKITFPLMTFCNLADPAIEKADIFNGWKVILFTVLFLIISILTMLLLSKMLKLDPNKRAVFFLMGSFANVLFLGYPLLAALYGPTQAALNVSLVSLAQNTILWTLGMYALSKITNSEKSAWKNLINPMTISIVLALIFKLSGIEIPSLIFEPLDRIGSVTPYLSMLFLGTVMALSPLKAMLKDKSVYVFILFKNFVLPLIFGVLSFSVFNFMLTPTQSGVLTVEYATSPMTSLAPFCKDNGLDHNLAGSLAVLSIIVNIVSIPLIWLICQKI